MGILDDLLQQHGGELLGVLQARAGFSADEASRFLPPALGQMLEAARGGGLDLASLLGGGGAAGVTELITKMDPGGLAAEADVEVGKARSGLESLLPVALALLQQHAGGASGLLSLLGSQSGQIGQSGEGGGALGAVAGLAGSLFGKK